MPRTFNLDNNADGAMEVVKANLHVFSEVDFFLYLAATRDASGAPSMAVKSIYRTFTGLPLQDFQLIYPMEA